MQPKPLLPWSGLHWDWHWLPLRPLSPRLFRQRVPVHRYQRGKKKKKKTSRMGWELQKGLAFLGVLWVPVVVVKRSLAIPPGAEVQQKHHFTGTKSVSHPASSSVLRWFYIQSSKAFVSKRYRDSNKINLFVCTTQESEFGYPIWS